MIEITWEIDGRRVPESQVGDALERSFYKQIAASMKSDLASVTCPEHGQHPQVVLEGKSGSELSFSIRGCCEKLIALATSKVSWPQGLSG